ncbi:hypothetical protein RRG08_031784 [Elysia crispata]|uniref:Uncharacterized protein n=1 Tax=Elysia crispata TaxID=231223 RepID=A0AAE1CSX2_9GAST|nr:hypothetical protein RRG08_031784 [Elysia crispata]
MDPMPSDNQYPCPVDSLYGRQSSHSPFGGTEDILTNGSALLSALMVQPGIFRVQSGCTSSLSLGNNRKKRKLTFAALHWASVGNPVVSWMLALQLDLENDSTHLNKRTNVEGHTYPTSCLIDIHDPNAAADVTCSTFWMRAKAAFRAKWRTAKVFFLLWGSLLLMVVSFLPFSIALIIWESGMRTHLSAQCVYIMCFFTYVTVPSLASLFLCLTNKPYRKVLLKYSCCLKKTRGISSG